jgi:hypothetical protein
VKNYRFPSASRQIERWAIWFARELKKTAHLLEQAEATTTR